MNDETTLLTTSEFAQATGKALSTIQGHIRQGRLVATKKGRDNFLTRDQLERFLADPPKPGRPEGRKRQINDTRL